MKSQQNHRIVKSGRDTIERSRLSRLRRALCGETYIPAFDADETYDWFVGAHSQPGSRAVIAWKSADGHWRPSAKSKHMDFWFLAKECGLVRLAEVFFDDPENPGELHHATIAIRTAPKSCRVMRSFGENHKLGGAAS